MYTLEPFQESFLNEIGESLTTRKSVIAQLEGGGGKCLAKDTPVLMYDGTIKLVQDINKGELLMGIDSTPRNVLSTCTGKELMYKITPIKGSPYIVNESHILSLKVSNGVRYFHFKGYSYWHGDIVNMSIKEYLSLCKTHKRMLVGWRTGVEFKRKNLKIDPYFLGLWLGDGTSDKVQITSGDSEIEYEIETFAIFNDCLVEKKYNSKNSSIYSLTDIRHRGMKGDGIRGIFRDLNLFKNKHIPQIYKSSSREQRLELLAGILDADGHLHNGFFEISQKNEILAKDILFLARSLGFAAYENRGKKTCYNNGSIGTYSRITISGDLNEIPCNIERKKAEPRLQKKNVLVTGIKVEPLEIDEYYGFELDGDRMFILGDFTVTHNTTIFANIAHRYIHKSNKDVIIFVNSEKLLDQARQTIFDWFEYVAQKIDAKTKTIPPNTRIFIAMIETFCNRVIDSNFRKHFSNVGLCIIDEAHIGNFRKALPFFIDAKKIGFTATPISAVKKEPLNLYYVGITCGISTKELIRLNSINPHRGLVPCREYTYQKNVDVKSIKKKGSEFDKDALAEAFSGKRQIDNTVEAYITKTYGQKAICFNADIQHSLDVTEAMVKAGLNARHLDGNKNGKYGNDNYRLNCFEWLKHTPNAILCNVGVATTGFDEKTIQVVINNSSMMSTTLFRQKRLRGSRAYVSPTGTIKEYFTHLDLGDNIIGCGHGEFDDDIDWKYIFENPKAPKPSIAPIKSCPLCGSINSAAARRCIGKNYSWLEGESDCEHEFEFNEENNLEDKSQLKLVLLGSGIDVKANIEYFKDKNEWGAYHILYEQIANLYKRNFPELFLEIEKIEECFLIAIQKATEWFKSMGKKRFYPFKPQVKRKMLEELRKVGFEISIEEENILFENEVDGNAPLT